MSAHEFYEQLLEVIKELLAEMQKQTELLETIKRNVHVERYVGGSVSCLRGDDNTFQASS